MSHVADGDLHAYLDGALSAYPVSEADRVREHLEQCEECRRRLREEEELRERAGSVLDRTDVGTLEPPPFEEIRQRARVRAGHAERSGPSRLGARLGWAASVVLALGTGWMLGHRSEAVRQGPLAADDEGRLARSAEAVRRDEADEVSSADVQSPAEGEELAGAAAPPIPTPGAARVGSRSNGAAGAEISEEVLADADLAQAAAPPLGRSAVAALREEPAVDEISDSALPANMLVPGLPVVQVRWTQLTPGVDGLVVQQRLVQDTTTLELRFLGLDGEVPIPEEEPSALFGPLPEGVNQVVVPLDGEFGWAALRGRLPRERLERLLDLLR